MKVFGRFVGLLALPHSAMGRPSARSLFDGKTTPMVKNTSFLGREFLLESIRRAYIEFVLTFCFPRSPDSLRAHEKYSRGDEHKKQKTNASRVSRDKYDKNFMTS